MQHGKRQPIKEKQRKEEHHMKKTEFETISNPILTNTNGLKALTQSGRENAVKIGIAAGARVQIGKSVRWNVEKVKRYIDAISTE